MIAGRPVTGRRNSPRTPAGAGVPVGTSGEAGAAADAEVPAGEVPCGGSTGRHGSPRLRGRSALPGRSVLPGRPALRAGGASRPTQSGSVAASSRTVRTSTALTATSAATAISTATRDQTIRSAMISATMPIEKPVTKRGSAYQGGTARPRERSIPAWTIRNRRPSRIGVRTKLSAKTSSTRWSLSTDQRTSGLSGTPNMTGRRWPRPARIDVVSKASITANHHHSVTATAATQQSTAVSGLDRVSSTSRTALSVASFGRRRWVVQIRRNAKRRLVSR